MYISDIKIVVEGVPLMVGVSLPYPLIALASVLLLGIKPLQYLEVLPLKHKLPFDDPFELLLEQPLVPRLAASPWLSLVQSHRPFALQALYPPLAHPILIVVIVVQQFLLDGLEVLLLHVFGSIFGSREGSG
jgi:hypothetical protein